MIRNILFDLGNVLIDLDVQRTFKAFEALLPQKSIKDLPVTALDLMGGGESKLVQLYQTGDISTEDFIRTILSICRPNTTREQVVNAWLAMLLQIPEQRLECLRQLKRAGYKVYILSNINELHVDWTLDYFRRCGIAVKGRNHLPETDIQSERIYLDGVFFSNEMHLAKPDARCYEEVIKQTGIRPEETLYIDDLPANIAAGQQAGLQVLQAVGDEWIPRLAMYD
ncbi:MAG: HAD family phosphatase [Paludibacteraceae bacterium]|nr:HAD family phosphatase [Paludibacteraceae bacterium]